jgi:hypothetical protein
VCAAHLESCFKVSPGAKQRQQQHQQLLAGSLASSLGLRLVLQGCRKICWFVDGSRCGGVSTTYLASCMQWQGCNGKSVWVSGSSSSKVIVYDRQDC